MGLKKKKIARKGTVEVARAVGATCNDPLNPYKTTYAHDYHTRNAAMGPQNQPADPQPACPAPTAVQEAAGLVAAKGHLESVAVGYCGAGRCESNETCAATVTGIQATKTGTSSRVQQNGTAWEQVCSISFDVSGNVECKCARNT